MGGGQMVFSLPNMQKQLENKWINYLNFEHTIFLNEDTIKYLLHKNHFSIIEKTYFSDHSIFIKARLDDTAKAQINLDYNAHKKLFLDLHHHYTALIEQLNSLLEQKDADAYLFGAHLFSQYLIYNGLHSQKILHILDNNPNKQEKRLYGTNLSVKSPAILKDKDNAFVILCAGVYNNEIEKDLKTMNPHLEIFKCQYQNTITPHCLTCLLNSNLREFLLHTHALR